MTSEEVQLYVAIQSSGTDPTTLAGVWGPFAREKDGYDWVSSVDNPDDELTWSIVPLNIPGNWGTEAVE